MESAHAADIAVPHYLVIHHTGIANSYMPAQLQAVNNSHRAKWGNVSPYTGYYVEYHYFIGSDGTIVQTRDDSERTGHTRCDDEGDHCKNGLIDINNDSLGIVLAGNFNVEYPSDAQMKSLKQVVTILQNKYGISKNHVIPHHEASATACPGSHLIEMLWKE